MESVSAPLLANKKDAVSNRERFLASNSIFFILPTPQAKHIQ
jgi:hypothetical protein